MCVILFFLASTLAVIAVAVCLSGEHLGKLTRLLRVAQSLASDTTQKAASAAGEPAKPASREISDETRARLARIGPGMGRGQVEEILGPCALARAEHAPGGPDVRIAMWMHGDDMIGVRFRNGVVATVVGTRMSGVGEASVPAGRGGDAAQEAGSPAAAPAPSAGPQDLQRRLRELEESLKAGRCGDDVFKQVFEAVTEKE